MKIIVNADDFGLTESNSLAIIDAFNKGYISSTTMCANGYYFDKASKLAKENNLDNRIGIHINLTEGESLTSGIKGDSFFCTDKKFHGKINRLRPLNLKQKEEVYEEVKAQIERMKKSGLTITHADSHHHIHTGIFIAPTIVKILKQYNIKKIRIHRNIGKVSKVKKVIKWVYNFWIRINKFTTVNYFGDMNDFKNWNSQESKKNIEIMVHPDYNENHVLVDRVNYASTLNDKALGEVLEVLKQIKEKKLCSYYDI